MSLLKVICIEHQNCTKTFQIRRNLKKKQVCCTATEEIDAKINFPIKCVLTNNQQQTTILRNFVIESNQ